MKRKHSSKTSKAQDERSSGPWPMSLGGGMHGMRGKERAREREEKKPSMDDGDSAHWVKAKWKKVTTPSDAKSSAKYTGKRKVARKRVAGK